MDLPTFRYHPDPISTGSIDESDNECACCGQRRGYIYTGPVYAVEELDESICPWCIASGEAHTRFNAEFVDAAGVGGHGSWGRVPKAVVEEVAYRTPGFTAWQQERWWTHCGDAAQFLGRAGASDVVRHGAATVEFLRADLGWDPGKQFDDYIHALDADGQPTAYLFRCVHCGAVGGYSDFT
jgi:uncharacterized protein CbrC (UPF0167 family)